MAAIQERKTQDGKAMYRVLVRLKGYPPQSATFDRKTDAKKWAQQTEAAIREGRHFKTREAKKHTVGNDARKSSSLAYPSQQVSLSLLRVLPSVLPELSGDFQPVRDPSPSGDATRSKL